MGHAFLELAREQVVGHRLSANALLERLPAGPHSLRVAAWAGLPDSMPRAALLSIHARVAGTRPDTWEDPSLVQLWGPRFSAYVVAEADRAVFTLGRLPEDGASVRRAEQAASRLEAFLGGRRMTYGEAGHAMGVAPNSLRYGAPTGRILMRWAGARQPVVWTVPPPSVAPADARRELARRYLHVLGPGSAGGFSHWGGVKLPLARSTFATLGPELIATRTPVGAGWILATDEASFREGPGVGDAASHEPRSPSGSRAGTSRAGTSAPDVRLLPSGDTFVLLWNTDRSLLVPDPRRRSELWTPRVWPGALLLDGEIAGTWRRGDAVVSIQAWRPLLPAERDAVDAEARRLPLPGLEGSLTVRWEA